MFSTETSIEYMICIYMIFIMLSGLMDERTWDVHPAKRHWLDSSPAQCLAVSKAWAYGVSESTTDVSDVARAVQHPWQACSY